MEFYFLGTGSGLPSKSRNVSGLAVRFLQKKSTQWLFDCGEATQHQLLNCPITLSKVDRIFISHLHGDHLFGLPGFLCSRSAQGAVTPLTIYGPEGIQLFVQTALSISQSYLTYEIDYVVVEEGLVYSDETIRVEALTLDHGIPCFAYKLIEADKPGALQVKRLLEIGIKPGPIFEQIKRGETVKLSDGHSLNGKEYIDEAKKGRVVIISSDTRPINEMKQFAYGAELLIHEGTFRIDMKSKADQFGHSTIGEVALLAKQANVKALVITHISSRYAEESAALEEEAKEVFSSAVIAYDLMVYKL